MTVTTDPRDSVVLPRAMTLEQWSRLDVERPVELVEGVPVVSPFETFRNLRAASRLAPLIEGHAPHAVLTTQVAVDLSAGGIPTVRIPDGVVTRADFDHDGAVIPASAVVLVVEVVSPSSVERDRVVKKAEYARAGIAAYLLVDLAAGHLVLFDRIEDGRYVDAAPAAEVTLTIGGTAVPIGLDDLTG